MGRLPSIDSRSRWVLALGAALGVLLVGACSSSGTHSASTSTPSSTAGADTATTALVVAGGHVLAAAEVSCYLAKRDQGGVIATDEGRSDAACTDRHNEESFTLSGTDSLDDCYRAVAASSDVVVGPDSYDPSKLEFTDDRIIGHTFATSDGSGTGPAGVTCAIELRDDRSTPLLAGSS
jgi:hypothetical protein